MIKSMTGYGKAERQHGNGRITVEMRSVNHRYGEISVKLPRALICFENDVRKTAAERLKRGKIDIFVQLDMVAAARPPVVNVPLARAYFDAFTALKAELGLEEKVSLSLIVSQKDVLTVVDSDEGVADMRDGLLAAVTEAVDAMEAMRLREGRELEEELRGRRANLAAFQERIRVLAPAVPLEYGEKLTARLAQLTAGTMPDESRIAQEIALMADHCDITEELVRFTSHLVQFDATLDSGEPVGRKLDFLLQEMGREVNTMGSKANAGEITTCVVAMKAELEKIREQIQNIE